MLEAVVVVVVAQYSHSFLVLKQVLIVQCRYEDFEEVKVVLFVLFHDEVGRSGICRGGLTILFRLLWVLEPDGRTEM